MPLAFAVSPKSDRHYHSLCLGLQTLHLRLDESLAADTQASCPSRSTPRPAQQHTEAHGKEGKKEDRHGHHRREHDTCHETKKARRTKLGTSCGLLAIIAWPHAPGLMTIKRIETKEAIIHRAQVFHMRLDLSASMAHDGMSEASVLVSGESAFFEELERRVGPDGSCGDSPFRERSLASPGDDDIATRDQLSLTLALRSSKKPDVEWVRVVLLSLKAISRAA